MVENLEIRIDNNVLAIGCGVWGQEDLQIHDRKEI